MQLQMGCTNNAIPCRIGHQHFKLFGSPEHGWKVEAVKGNESPFAALQKKAVGKSLRCLPYGWIATSSECFVWVFLPLRCTRYWKDYSFTPFTVTVATSIWNTCVFSFPWSSLIVPCCLKPWWSLFCNLLLHQRRDCRAMALLRPQLGPKSWTRSPPQKWKWQVQVLQLGDVLNSPRFVEIPCHERISPISCLPMCLLAQSWVGRFAGLNFTIIYHWCLYWWSWRGVWICLDMFGLDRLWAQREKVRRS